jgi:hypothetical protein
MVPGQDAQPARVLRERRRHAVFRREVRHPGRAARKLRTGLVPPRPGQVLAQLVGRVPEPAQEAPVGGERKQPLLRHLGQQGHRILAGPLPPVRVDPGEKLQRLGMP